MTVPLTILPCTHVPEMCVIDRVMDRRQCIRVGAETVPSVPPPLTMVLVIIGVRVRAETFLPVLYPIT